MSQCFSGCKILVVFATQTIILFIIMAPRTGSLNIMLTYNFKVIVIQIEKALINDPYVFQKYPENFAFQLFIIFQ